MNTESEKLVSLPDLPEKIFSSTPNVMTMNNAGYNPYMYNNMNSYNGGNMFMGGGMFGGSMSSNNPHLPAGLQQSLSLLETILITIGSTTQLIESSYVAAKGLMHTFKEIHIQFQSLKKDFRNGVLSMIYLLKKFLLIKRDKTSLSGDEKKSLKRLLIFVGLITGIPVILKRFISFPDQPVSFSSKAENTISSGDLINPSNAQFIRATYEYIPASSTSGELAIKKGEILAVISKKDAFGNKSQWWKVRNKIGESGYIPSNYIEILERKED
ncbi:hypothetical protein QEN19_003285 [Hanseniaspora menglaensis]